LFKKHFVLSTRCSCLFVNEFVQSDTR